MVESGANGPEPSRTDRPRPAAESPGRQDRLGNPTRLVPRRPPTTEAAPETEASELLEDGYAREDQAPPSGGRVPNSLFAPRSFSNGRIQVWGFAPGCLLASLIASVVLTILLNMVF